MIFFFFFFQAEDGIRDGTVTGVQTCALPISPPVSTTAAIGLMRKPRGCNAGVAMICWRRSGDALMRTNGASANDDGPFGLLVTAMLVWVRGLTRGSPAHASRHTSQLQFH